MKIGLFTKRHHIDVDNHMVYAHHWPNKALLIVYNIPIGLGFVRYKFAKKLGEGWPPEGWLIIFFFFKLMV